MPTYEFRCPEGHEFEKFYRTISGAEAQAACPQCGLPAERVMSATGFAFKGSGFYLTDYGKNAHRGTAPEGKTGAPTAEGPKGDARSETKSETKSDVARGGGGEGSSAGGGEAKPAAPKAAEAKPAAAPPKKSSSE
jgi:putative FmdB family regulatory protein